MDNYEYKPSGIEWLGDVPRHWNVDRLRDVCILNSESLEPSTRGDLEFQYLDIGNVDSGGVISFDEILELTFDTAPSRARRLTRKFDTIISSVRTNLQAVAFIDFETKKLVCSTGFFVCRPKYVSYLNPRFLYYFLLTEYSKGFFVSNSVGVSYPAIGDYKFGSVNLPIPPVEEQRVIAEYLDKACDRLDRIISIKQTQLENISGFYKSRVNEILSGSGGDSEKLDQWRSIRLKQTLSKVNSGVTPKGGSTSYVDEGVPLIRSQNVNFEAVDLSDAVYITPETHQSMSNSKVNSGDVLLNITGASLGRCAYVAHIIEANVNQHVCILRPFQFITMKYLYYLILSELVQSQIFSSFTGSGREGLSFRSIRSFRVKLPQKDFQNRIVNVVDQLAAKVAKTTELLERQINSLKAYRKSLVHECVTGKKQVYAE